MPTFRILGGGGFFRWKFFRLHYSSVMVCARVNLDFVGMLVSRLGGESGVGFRPFVVYPPSCRGGWFHTTEQFCGDVRLIGAVFPLLGVVFQNFCRNTEDEII